MQKNKAKVDNTTQRPFVIIIFHLMFCEKLYYEVICQNMKMVTPLTDWEYWMQIFKGFCIQIRLIGCGWAQTKTGSGSDPMESRIRYMFLYKASPTYWQMKSLKKTHSITFYCRIVKYFIPLNANLL